MTGQGGSVAELRDPVQISVPVDDGELSALYWAADAPGSPNVPLHHPGFLPPNEAVGAVARAPAVAFAAAPAL